MYNKSMKVYNMFLFVHYILRFVSFILNESYLLNFIRMFSYVRETFKQFFLLFFVFIKNILKLSLL